MSFTALNSNSKMTPDHLMKTAYLYIRQSTLRQVFENTESTPICAASPGFSGTEFDLNHGALVTPTLIDRCGSKEPFREEPLDKYL
jgi:hypothetical protein